MLEQLPVLPAAEHLFDRFPCGLLVTTTTGLIFQVNQTICTWVGFERDELVGQRRLDELFTMGGRIFHQTHWVPTLQMQGSLAEVKFEVRHKAGHTIPMMLNAVRRTGESSSYDEVVATVAEERNKYERELLAARQRADDLVKTQRLAQAELSISQASLRQAVRIGAMCLWSINAKSGRREYEDDVARLLGFDTPRPISEALFESAIAPHDRVREQEALARALDRSHDSYQCSFRLNGSDGVQRTVVSSGQGFFDAHGVLTSFVGVLSDVTDATRQRALAEDRALFAEQMVGIVSHDLRNPLSAILMGAKILSQTETAPHKVRVLGHVTNSATRAQRLIEELLDFTQTRVGGGLPVTARTLDLHALVATIVAELTLAFPERHILHRLAGEGDVIADPDRVAQLLGNLVGNAMAYGTPEGTVTVRSLIDEDCASVSVHNTGTAIPADRIEALFEPMVRGVPEASSARSVGLGLFIVKAIAKAHEGDVQVVSSPATGTEFTFSFPSHPRR
jgi:sigma-B regulation protein RsbU (phosphoserine phosphatase)